MEQFQQPLLLPSVPSYPTSAGQDFETEDKEVDIDSSMVVGETVLSLYAQYDSGSTEDSCEQQDDNRYGNGGSSPRFETPEISRSSCFWNLHRPERDQLSATASELVEASWRKQTEKSYGIAWSKWIKWCAKHELSPSSPSLSHVLNYLSYLYESGAQYRTINVQRSALSSTLLPIEGFSVGQHPLVCRLMKGIFNKRPPRPKLFPSWSVVKVLETLKKWSPPESLSIKLLSYKTVMLLALASCKRPGSISLLSVDEKYCRVGIEQIVFQPVSLEKTENMSHTAKPLEIDSFVQDTSICPVFYLKAYMERVKDLRSTDSLFVILRKPYSEAAASTLARWLSDVIILSGQEGSGGSTRSVSSSYAIGRGATLTSVLSAGDWARASTFRKFYFKPTEVSVQDFVIH